jgi:hypothetical protein
MAIGGWTACAEDSTAGSTTTAGALKDSSRAPKPKSSSARGVANGDEARPHLSRGYLMPAEFAVKFKPGAAATARSECLRRRLLQQPSSKGIRKVQDTRAVSIHCGPKNLGRSGKQENNSNTLIWIQQS